MLNVNSLKNLNGSTFLRQHYNRIAYSNGGLMLHHHLLHHWTIEWHTLRSTIHHTKLRRELLRWLLLLSHKLVMTPVPLWTSNRNTIMVLRKSLKTLLTHKFSLAWHKITTRSHHLLMVIVHLHPWHDLLVLLLSINKPIWTKCLRYSKILRVWWSISHMNFTMSVGTCISILAHLVLFIEFTFHSLVIKVYSRELLLRQLIHHETMTIIMNKLILVSPSII